MTTQATSETVVSRSVTTITLTMSERDARALASVTQFIGGPPDGPRGALDRIMGALRDVGIRAVVECDKLRYDGRITMKNEWPTGVAYYDAS